MPAPAGTTLKIVVYDLRDAGLSPGPIADLEFDPTLASNPGWRHDTCGSACECAWLMRCIVWAASSVL